MEIDRRDKMIRTIMQRLAPGKRVRFEHAFEVVSDRGDLFENARPLSLKDTSWE